MKCFPFQSTYDKVPTVGESHAHIMNLLPCDLDMRISSPDGLYNNHFDVASNLNSVVYDLEKGTYELEVRVGAACPTLNKMKKITFDAKDEIVRQL